MARACLVQTASALTGTVTTPGVRPIFATAAALNSALAAEGLSGVSISAIEAVPAPTTVQIDVLPPALPHPPGSPPPPPPPPSQPPSPQPLLPPSSDNEDSDNDYSDSDNEDSDNEDSSASG